MPHQPRAHVVTEALIANLWAQSEQNVPASGLRKVMTPKLLTLFNTTTRGCAETLWHWVQRIGSGPGGLGGGGGGGGG